MGHNLPEVAAAVRSVITEASATQTFEQLLFELMGRNERVRGPGGAAAWSAFVLGSCGALGGDMSAAIWAATAVEFVTAAAEVVDDLVDDEWGDQHSPPSRAINANVALICLGLQSVNRLADSLGPQRTRLIGDLLTRGYVGASAGEDLDLQLEATTMVSEDQAYEMTRRKSGSLVAMACEVGAAVATDNQAIIEAMGLFGCHVGVAAQILNDITGIDSANPKRSSDLRRRKKTLPIVFALSCAREEGNEELLGWYQNVDAPSAASEQEIAAIIRNLGGLHYGWVLADIHRKAALMTLEELAQTTGRAEVRELRRLLSKNHPATR